GLERDWGNRIATRQRRTARSYQDPTVRRVPEGSIDKTGPVSSRVHPGPVVPGSSTPTGSHEQQEYSIDEHWSDCKGDHPTESGVRAPSRPGSQGVGVKRGARARMSFLDCYLSGDHEAVWGNLVALGHEVRHAAQFADAYAVAKETMRRARCNVEILAER